MTRLRPMTDDNGREQANNAQMTVPSSFVIRLLS
jgi:hypothetical protein